MTLPPDLINHALKDNGNADLSALPFCLRERD
jgi:hypothetical protein